MITTESQHHRYLSVCSLLLECNSTYKEVGEGKVLEISESHSYMLKVFFKTGILKEGQLFRRSLGTRHSSGFGVLELFRKIYSRNHLHCGWFVSFSRCRGVWKIISEAATKCGRRICPSLLLSFGWVSSPRGLLYYIRQCLLYFFP